MTEERSAVITGATGGIGRWIALGLADAGFRLFLVGRDPTRLQATLGWIAERTPHPAHPHVPVMADLSLLGQTRSAATTIRAHTDRLALLINNAGILSPRRIVTSEGMEQTLAVNHLTPFVLTRHLLPLLQLGAQDGQAARIIDIGSSMSDHARIDPDDLQLTRHWGMVRAYAGSKLAMLCTSLALAEQLKASRIRVNIVHPGLVATGLVRGRGVVGLAWRMMAPFAASERQGASTPLRAALSPDFESVTGTYLKAARPAAPNPRALDPDLRARVCAATAVLASKFLPEFEADAT